MSPIKYAGVFLSAIEGTHTAPMNIFHLIFSELLYLDPLSAFLCHEYITKDTKENNFICGGKKNTTPWRIRMAAEGRCIIKRSFFISSFWK